MDKDGSILWDCLGEIKQGQIIVAKSFLNILKAQSMTKNIEILDKSYRIKAIFFVDRDKRNNGEFFAMIDVLGQSSGKITMKASDRQSISILIIVIAEKEIVTELSDPNC